MTLHERVQLLVTGFLVVLALTAVVAAVSVGQRDQLVTDSEVYNDSRDEVTSLLTDYVDQQTAVRGYVITADPDVLIPYEEAQVEATRTLDELRSALTGTDPGLVDQIDAVEESAARWREDGADAEIAATENGEAGAAAAVVAQGTGLQLFEALRADLAMLGESLRSRQMETDARLVQARRQINLALVMTFITGALLLFVVSVALQRWSTRPLLEIMTAMREVTDGDLQRRIPAVGPRDIAEVGADADLMRRRIVTQLDAARRAEQALRSRGALVSILRDELAPKGEVLPDNMAMAAAFEPVKGVLAGDWYDAFCLDDGRIAMCLIDVSGHGQSTGVFALQAKNLLLAATRQLLDPGAVLAWMARALGDTGDNFLTCFIARIDPATGLCEYASAGHLPTLVVREGDGLRELGPTGPLLGPLPGVWTTERLELAPASVIVAYTDGITEARGSGSEEFGEERLRAVLAARAAEHPTVLIGTCVDAVHDFSRGEAADDLTIVALRWLPQDE